MLGEHGAFCVREGRWQRLAQAGRFWYPDQLSREYRNRPQFSQVWS